MNSLLQLLFMSSRFRIGLLLEADKADPDSSRHDVFDRLVETFSYLIFSKKRFFDPNELFTCFSVSPTTQMDVDEYLNMLFDKIEGRVKELLLDCFGGSLINQVSFNLSSLLCDIGGTIENCPTIFVTELFCRGGGKREMGSNVI